MRVEFYGESMDGLIMQLPDRLTTFKKPLPREVSPKLDVDVAHFPTIPHELYEMGTAQTGRILFRWQGYR